MTNHFDPALARLADRHYSRQSIGSRQVGPPGMRLCLYIPGPQWPFEVLAGWIWWHPHPNYVPQGRMTLRRYDGYDGWWNCSFFRNEGVGVLSSELIDEAVRIVDARWGVPPFGYDTYIWPEKLESRNPGYCYIMAGWQKGGWSQDGKKRRLFLPLGAILS